MCAYMHSYKLWYTCMGLEQGTCQGTKSTSKYGSNLAFIGFHIWNHLCSPDKHKQML